MKNKKGLILGLICFLGLIIGATFAYFDLVDSTDSSLTLREIIPEVGSVSLIGGETTGTITISEDDMDYANVGEIYTYPSNGTPSTVATITASGDAEDNITYYCTVKVKINNSITSGSVSSGDINIEFAGDLKNVLKNSNNIIFNNITPVGDSTSITGNISTTLTDEFAITSGSSYTLTELIKVNNTSGLQDNLNNASINFSTEVTNLSCDTTHHTPIFLVNGSDSDVRGKGGLSSTLTGGMYRYQGAATDTINNYICIGSDTCQTSTMTSSSYDDNTYRIIGITSDGRMKVIKMGFSNLGNSGSYYWYWNSTGEGTAYDWTNATVRQILNNTESGYYLDSLGDYANYIDSSSDSKFYSTATRGVSNPTYISYSNEVGSGHSQSATDLYALETGGTIASYGTNEVDNEGYGYKVGLMQISDYYLAASDSANCSQDGGSYSTCRASWLYFKNNDTRVSYELIITRESAYSSYNINDGGYMNTNSLIYTNGNGLRPVFYLKSSINLKGEGTKENPYYIVILNQES